MCRKALVLILILSNLTICFFFQIRPLRRKHAPIKDGLLEGDTLPALSNSIIGDLTSTVGTFMTVSAMKTVGYYMTEFRDDITRNWMNSFLNYEEVGFPNGDWREFLFQMINTDLQQIKVTLQPPKRVSEQSRLKALTVSYLHDIEPRKIAQRIIAVREDISHELIQDLGSIKYEHLEAMKYGKVCMSEGKENAEKTRGITRMHEIDESTPFRDQNFSNCSLLVSVPFSIEYILYLIGIR
jgi:hypothetical protein